MAAASTDDASRPPVPAALKAYIGGAVTALPSPSFVVDLDKFEENSKRMQARCAAKSVAIRPHVKTHKTVEGTRIMLAGVPPSERRIVVSSLAEAEHFAAYGFQDITYGLPVEPSKVPRIEAVLATGVNFSVFIDTMDGLEALAKARATVASASASDGKEGEAAPASVLGVFIKVDCGYARAGARYDDAETVELVQAVVKSPLFKLTGLYSHSGNSYNVGAEEAKRIGQEEVTRVVDLATRLREAGIDVPVVSIGATPSVSQEVDWTGVTEVHPGNYCFLDRQQVACGSATLEQIAVFVLARVASRYPKRNEVLLDAGGVALHKDAAGIDMWGHLPEHPHLNMYKISQEHGVCHSDTPIDFSAAGGLCVGDAVRVLPNHSCMTASGHAHYFVCRGDKVVDVWVPAKGW